MKTQPQPVLNTRPYKLFYLRVSKQEQDIEKDKMLLSKHIDDGDKENVDYRFFSEKISATKTQTELENLLQFAPPQSIIYCTELSRLNRSTRELLNLIHELKKRNIGLQIERMPQISFLPGDPEDPIKNMMLTVISMFAQSETEFLSQRTRAGLAKSRANGIRSGRKVDQKTRTIYRQLAIEKKWHGTMQQLAKAIGVSVQGLSNIRRQVRDDDKDTARL